MQSSKEKARSFFDKVEHARGIFHYNDIPLLLEYFAEAFDEYEAKLKIATEALEFIGDEENYFGSADYKKEPHSVRELQEIASQALEALKGDM